MQALLKVRPAPGAEFGDVPVPRPAPDEVLIKVKAASVCGTDLHIFNWDAWSASRIKTPLVFGHECTGEVVEVGANVSDVPVGSHVSVETHITCGHCYQCRTGAEHVCRNVKVVGVDRPRAYAEYLAVPARNAWINDDSLPWEIATLLEPFGNAVHAVHAGEGVSGKTVLVSGCGPIGIMSIAVAKAQGALAVYATEVNPYRIDLARKMGPTAVYDAAKTDVFEAIMDQTKGEGVDVLLEMSGAVKGMEDGFRVLKNGGSAALLGLPSAPPKFDLTDHIIMKGAKVYGIYGREMFRTWYRSKALVQSGLVDLSKIITHTFPLKKFPEAMEVVASGKCGKIVLRG
ncbi:MAG: L-threonine 3-dehydrogenase [Pseudomonadota bacterium]